MRADGCTHRTLAAGECCRVDHCDHGTLHVTLGAVTLRLTAEQLRDVAATLEAAAQGLLASAPIARGRLLC